MRVLTEERKFSFTLGDGRLAEIAREVGENLKRIKQLEEQLLAAKEGSKGIASLMQSVKEQGVLIDRGTEERTVLCEWKYDNPEENLKSLFRTDTNELVEGSTAEMTDEEKQGELFVGEGGLNSGGIDETPKPLNDEMHDPNLEIPPAPPEE